MKSRWLVVAVVMSYLIMLFGGGALKPDYSHISQYISELNATGTPYAQPIGWFGFILFGALAGALLIITAGRAPVRGVSRVGYWMLMIQPIAYIGSALAPCDVGCPIEGSVSQSIHNMLGLVTFILTTLGLFLLSFTPKISIFFRVVWITVSLVWLILFTLMLDNSMTEWRGILQRLAEWVVYSALCISAWRLLGENHSFKYISR